MDNHEKINMERLSAQGITQIGFQLSHTVQSEFKKICDSSAIPPTPITNNCVGYDARGKEIDTLGFIEAAHTFGSVNYKKQYHSTLYVNLLYSEVKYRGCGIAAALLDALPEMLTSEHGILADAIVLASAPQKKTEQGNYEQLQGIDFWLEKMRLTKMYMKLGFEVVDMFYMVKEISNQQNEVEKNG